MQSFKYFLPKSPKDPPSNMPAIVTAPSKAVAEAPQRLSDALHSDIDVLLMKRMQDCALARWNIQRDEIDSGSPIAHPRKSARVRADISKANSQTRSSSQSGRERLQSEKKKSDPSLRKSQTQKRPTRRQLSPTGRQPMKDTSTSSDITSNRRPKHSGRRSKVDSPEQTTKRRSRSPRKQKSLSRSSSRSVSPRPPVKPNRNRVMSHAA